jgi:hypothetical protein
MLDGRHTWVERSIPELPYSIEDLRPKSMQEIFEERTAASGKSVEEERDRPVLSTA